MGGFQALARDNGSRTLQDPPIIEFPPFPKCYGPDCISLDYRIITSKSNTKMPLWANHTIDYIAYHSGLSK